jgi:hypothetical protein
MATVASRLYIVAAFNIMIAARIGEKTHPPFSREEILDILTAMAEADDVVSNPPVESRNRWQWAPADNI